MGTSVFRGKGCGCYNTGTFFINPFFLNLLPVNGQDLQH